jgi:hypothetical protein
LAEQNIDFCGVYLMSIVKTFHFRGRYLNSSGEARAPGHSQIKRSVGIRPHAPAMETLKKGVNGEKERGSGEKARKAQSVAKK